MTPYLLDQATGVFSNTTDLSIFDEKMEHALIIACSIVVVRLRRCWPMNIIKKVDIYYFLYRQSWWIYLC